MATEEDYGEMGWGDTTEVLAEHQRDWSLEMRWHGTVDESRGIVALVGEVPPATITWMTRTRRRTDDWAAKVRAADTKVELIRLQRDYDHLVELIKPITDLAWPSDSPHNPDFDELQILQSPKATQWLTSGTVHYLNMAVRPQKPCPNLEGGGVCSIPRTLGPPVAKKPCRVSERACPDNPNNKYDPKIRYNTKV